MTTNDRTCPECGSDDIRVYLEADEYECRDCGESWAGYELLE